MNYFDDLEIPFAMPVADGHCRTHTPLYYGIQYNQAGAVDLKIGNGPRRTISGPQVFITHPGTEFSYHLQPGVKHYFYAVCFTGDRVRKFIEGGLLSLEPVIYPVRDTARFMQTILELIKMRSLGQQNVCVNLVESLLLQLQLPGERKFINQPPYQIDALKSLAERIRQDCSREWDFSRESGKMFISERHFRTLFTLVNDLPPQHFLLRIRLEQAAKLLVHSKDTVKSIAGECGFPDEYYFSRIFKKYYRLAPKQYRQEFGSFN